MYIFNLLTNFNGHTTISLYSCNYIQGYINNVLVMMISCVSWLLTSTSCHYWRADLKTTNLAMYVARKELQVHQYSSIKRLRIYLTSTQNHYQHFIYKVSSPCSSIQ